MNVLRKSYIFKIHYSSAGIWASRYESRPTDYGIGQNWRVGLGSPTYGTHVKREREIRKDTEFSRKNSVSVV